MINQHPTYFIFPKTIDNKSIRKEEAFSAKDHHKFKHKALQKHTQLTKSRKALYQNNKKAHLEPIILYENAVLK